MKSYTAFAFSVLAVPLLVGCGPSTGSAISGHQAGTRSSSEPRTSPTTSQDARSDTRDEEAMLDDAPSAPPSYEVGIASAAATREQSLAACDEETGAARDACKAEANAAWDERKSTLEPSRGSSQ